MLDRTASRARVQALARLRLDALAQQAEQIETARTALQRLLGACQSGSRGPCPIIEAFTVEAPRRAKK